MARFNAKTIGEPSEAESASGVALAMAFDDPTMDDDLREILAAHEIVLREKWADGRPRLGVVCATEADDGLNNGRRPATRQQMSRKNGALGG